MNSEQSRSTKQGERTKSYFKQAFIELIHEKGFSHVSVTDIIRKAEYNRTTFYLHYQDKYCLTEDLQAEMFRYIKEKSVNKYEREKSVETISMGPHSFELIHFIHQNQNFFNLYRIDDTIPGLHRDLPQAIYEVLKEDFYLIAVNQRRDINYDAHKLYMAHGTAGLILDWINKDYHVSPEEMSIQLIHILESFAKQFMIKSRE
ncbi:TetR/AcrR family transcriptional regulator [Alkalihalobacillus pseudalcaliphilus]|uniref:TetR/AcrR family transcriptional regulator n=1 Tax=Alkalihalobacillus pseudalcaliphilus TaxID=79884 RepID=UPI00069D03C0|nr:TetR/AcrR family transcriptional regulator [Alkalihalobacillus pseudalcaliphilus]